jgi:hypothetical protein
MKFNATDSLALKFIQVYLVYIFPLILQAITQTILEHVHVTLITYTKITGTHPKAIRPFFNSDSVN